MLINVLIVAISCLVVYTNAQLTLSTAGSKVSSDRNLQSTTYFTFIITKKSDGSVVFNSYFSVIGEQITAWYDYSKPIGGGYENIQLSPNDIDSYSGGDNKFFPSTLKFSGACSNFKSEALQVVLGTLSSHFCVYDYNALWQEANHPNNDLLDDSAVLNLVVYVGLTAPVTTTAIPTAAPTLIPTAPPSRIPTTFTPTNTPTISPTLVPTIKASSVIAYSITQSAPIWGGSYPFSNIAAIDNNCWLGPDQQSSSYKFGGNPTFFFILDLSTQYLVESLKVSQCNNFKDVYAVNELQVSMSSDGITYSSTVTVSLDMTITSIQTLNIGLNGRYLKVLITKYAQFSSGADYIAPFGQVSAPGPPTQSPTANPTLLPTRIPTVPTFLPTIMPTQVFGYYVGCYRDEDIRAVSLTLNDYVPVDVCKSRALDFGYRYFALQDYYQFHGICFYTNNLPDFFRYGSLPTSDTGYAYYKCHYTTNTDGLRVAVGGAYANAVHDTQPPPPTFSPTFVPTIVPTIMPSVNPTPRPSPLPTAPTFVPTTRPTSSPTLVPSKKPSSSPTLVPTRRPTLAPTSKPSLAPSQKPTLVPTLVPSRKPTNQPTTMKPTNKRTSSPTNKKLKRNKIYMLCKSTDGGNSNCEWKNDGPTYRST